MRSSSCWTVLLALVALAMGCTTVSPDQCWPNTSGGFGGSGTIPIGAGVGAVGATSGGFNDSPGADNPCVTPEGSPGNHGSVEASLKVFCLTPDMGAICSERCMAKGLPCVAHAVHPYKLGAGIGDLFSCNDPLLGFMCGYHYPNGDDCNYYFGFPHPPFCAYSGN